MYHNRKILLTLLGVCSMFIIFAHVVSNNGVPVIREMQQSGRNLASLDSNTLPIVQDDGTDVKTEKAPDDAANVEKRVERTMYDRVLDVVKCMDRPMVPKTQQRGDYWVLYNYITANRRFRCHESVTYTTHADYSFMDNIVPLLERWRGPISIAIHAPGTDFENTIESIGYLRDCTDPLVKEFVTFHVYFSTKHVPKVVPKHEKVLNEPYNCSIPPPYANVSSDQMYKTQKNLLYPVNVGRNVAREMAQTHFILPSDIELYPSPNLITKFLTMVAENKGPLLGKNPKVYPLHLFEVSANQQIPESKTQLKEMLGNGTAIPFHKNLCPSCHNIPKAKEWQNADETVGLHVFHVGKRNGKFIHWEPIFIGTHSDPLYDERLSWEGKSDKMTQGYALCVMDYDFLILDNAFLVHKPGIKLYKKDSRRATLSAKTNQLIKKIIYPELKVLYGIKKGCAV
ncbi:beta-1,4-glucuronyltransferase 1 [Aethina tumida]|uniref:beta-1,4-glucuronyltransferase 1 n=1 Tax=Aethina tumida TaxID=116153 RepID=UPI00214805C0|nr:beta-1,4-glucuronyltransferase 1 [Aethina tumida]XP_049820481.1 beta-1,4-glucuronyltransferase 1 [Aethina tumida]